MPVNSESINRKLFDLLSVRGYDPKPLDVEGKVTPVPEEAAVIKFDFIKDGENYGKVWASIDGAKTLQLYYGDSVTNSPDDPTRDSDYDDTWTGLIKHLKNWAQRRQLGFELKNENHLVSDMARRKHSENLNESDISGLLAASRLNRSFIITAQTAEGQTKKYRVKAQSPNVAKEKFMKHHSMAKIVDVKEEGVAEGYEKKDMTGKTCEKCKKDTYQERSLHDDWEGTLRCSCGHVVDRWRKYKKKDDEQGVAEGQESMKQVNEGYYPMGKQGSYSDAIPTTKIILQHTRKIEEGEQRYRNVAKIFVENANGERFLLPTTKPGIARVYARHIAEGGTPYDERGKHITSLVEEYSKMAGFVRATRNKQFNESAQQLVNEGVNHYQSLRETLHKMCGHRGYNAYFESYTPTLVEDGEEQSNLNELFVQETLDPRIESVMPILSRLHKKVSEMKEVGELAEWADSLEEAEEIQEENTPLRDKEDLMARRKALQDILSDPDTAKDPLLKREAMKRKHDLEKEAESKGLAEEMVDESSNVPMDVRALYAQTYAKFAKTAGAAKGAKQMAYAMVKKKYGTDMAEKLKAYHNSNLDEELGEDLDANQKRAGQLGPTEKVGPKGAVGKLVGANESVEQNVAEGYILKKTNVEKYMKPGDPDEYTQDINIKDTDYEIINNKTGQVVGTASWTTNDYFGPGALKITMKNGATRYLDIWEREKGNPQTAFNRFVKDPKTAKKYKEEGVAEGSKVKTAKGHSDVVQGTDVKTIAKADLGKNELNLPQGYGDVVQPQKLKTIAKAKGLNEMDKSAPQPGRDGKVSHSTYGSRDEKGSDYFKGKESPGKHITKKQAEKDALDSLNQAMDKAHKKEVKEGQEDLDAILRIIKK